MHLVLVRKLFMLLTNKTIPPPFIYFIRYQLLHSEELLKAFQALDTESKGHLTIDEAKNFFSRHGEAFAQV